MATVSTTITYLEMTAEPVLRIQRPLRMKLMLMRAEQPEVAFYRYLYDAVGRHLYWVDRKRLTDAALTEIIRNPKVEVWVVYVNGQPGGFFEVDGREGPAHVELAMFGLIPAFQGLGLGKWLLAEAIRAAWAKKPQRVIVNTCTLDGPAALPLYQKLGFVPYDREEYEFETTD
jgi:GNAT superfamily N-acetyltransferase